MKNMTMKALTGLLLLNISTTSMFGVFGVGKGNNYKAGLYKWVMSGPRRVFSAADSYLNSSSDEFPLSRVEVAKVAATQCAQKAKDAGTSLANATTSALNACADCAVHDVKAAVDLTTTIVAYPAQQIVAKVTQPAHRLLDRVETMKKDLPETAKAAGEVLSTTMIRTIQKEVIGEQQQPSNNQPAQQPQQPKTPLLTHLKNAIEQATSKASESAKDISRMIRKDATKLVIKGTFAVTIGAILVIAARHVIKSGYIRQLIPA